MSDKKVRDLMRHEVVTIPHTATFHEALQTCIEHKVNGVVLVDESGKYVNFLDAATLLRAALPDYIEDDLTAAKFADDEFVVDELKKIGERPVLEILDHEMKTARPDDSLVYAIAVASHNGQGRLPVLDNDGKPVGLLTRTELKRVLGGVMGIPDAL